MSNDVTFGQYYPAKSFVHNMDARAKLVFVIAYIVAIFLAKNFVALGVVTLFLIFITSLRVATASAKPWSTTFSEDASEEANAEAEP